MTGIIILNWNGWEDTIDCLKSLKQITDTEYFIVLVDNGSNNNSVEKIEEYLREYEIDNSPAPSSPSPPCPRRAWPPRWRRR